MSRSCRLLFVAVVLTGACRLDSKSEGGEQASEQADSGMDTSGDPIEVSDAFLSVSATVLDIPTVVQVTWETDSAATGVVHACGGV